MLENIDGLKKQLAELASLLNGFKSEAVQLRILDFVLSGDSGHESTNESSSAKSTGVHKRKSPPPAKKPAQEGGGKRKTASAGSGANATLSQLAAGTFFEKPKAINDIIEHCRHNLARTFKANEFSGKLARMVRSGELTRKKNAEKQYEYKKP